MKKKIIIAMAILGMAFATVQVSAQNGRVAGNDTGKFDAGKLAAHVVLPDGNHDCTACSPRGCCSVVNCIGD